MTMINDALAPVTDAELADITETLMDLPVDFEADASGAVEVIEEPADVIEDVVEAPAGDDEIDLSALDALDTEIEAAVAELDLAEARNEAYAEMGSVGDAVTELPEPAAEAPSPAEPAPAEAAAKPAKAPKAPKAPKPPAAPKVKATVEDLPVENFVLETADASASDLPALKASVIARRPAQKKVAEKFDNVLLALAAGRAPSVYTLDCYRVLKAGGETTSAGLAAALTSTKKRQDVSSTYTIGTARSQAGQFMALAPALKIAKRDGNKLVLNPDSVIAMALDAILAPAA